MNNNIRGNNNNNRRRGRGNNNRPQGGQPLNRIDSRARGNAPQLLEKYRKLAQDAHMNGDRVNAEYFLQFADHYFRVLADARVRQDESRGRRDERGFDGGDADRDDGDDAGEFGGASDFPNFDAPAAYARPARDDRPKEDRPVRDDRPVREDRPNDRTTNRDDRSQRSPDRWRQDRAPSASAEPETSGSGDGQAVGAARSAFESEENPFLRNAREARDGRATIAATERAERAEAGEPAGTRGLRPRRQTARPRDDDATPAPAGLDPSSLPPAISATRRAAATSDGDVTVETTAAPKRRPRRKATDEAVEAAG